MLSSHAFMPPAARLSRLARLAPACRGGALHRGPHVSFQLPSRPFSASISLSVLSSPVTVSSPESLSIKHPAPAIPASHSSSGPLPDAYFACNVFDRRMVKKYLTAADYTRYMECITNYQPIDAATADTIATALLRWATEKGATHFTHWFQPITGSTAEKVSDAEERAA